MHLGAAVSPNMGYHSSPVIGFLLMLFNIRLGWWLGNPKRTTYQAEGQTFSAVPLAEELAGQTIRQPLDLSVGWRPLRKSRAV